ncbi:MAG TPA: hypothetical protein VNR65_07050 [Geobacterales bacterium]|nr:hypothetical protein [Geobacterales bacterium]
MSVREFLGLPHTTGSLLVLTLAVVAGAAPPSYADVVTDWDAKATVAAPPGALGERELVIVDLAMFDAVNSIARRYPPYLVREERYGGTSGEAADASAAATALEKLRPQSAAEWKTELDGYLKGLSASHDAVEQGARLGTLVALRVFEPRAADGANGVDPYRPRTQPGVYVPTATMVSSTWPTMRPIVLERPEQFRPGPPSRLRVPNGRRTTMYAVALYDAYVAVFDAKYTYEFWRPITAIRNGDIDGNPATDIDPLWQPLDDTPMHSEYPCAHCIQSATAAALIEASGAMANLQEPILKSPKSAGRYPPLVVARSLQ